MTYFAGLDVSVKETSVCIVDDAGKIVREARVASEPEALLQVLTNTIYRFQASWAGSRTAIAVALQRSRRSGLAGDLR
jgi:predicted NBD/HSP70 family sugar kinase